MSHGYTSSTGRLIIGRHRGGYLYVSIGDISNFPVQQVADSEFHEFEASAYHLKYSFDGINYQSSSSYSEKETNFNITLFARLSNWESPGQLECFVKGKCCTAYILYKDSPVRNFIPCYSTTTVTDVDGTERPAGTVGMYDTIDGKFYVNKGTGTFGYGMGDGTYVVPSPTNN